MPPLPQPDALHRESRAHTVTSRGDSRWAYRACDLCEAICGLAFRFDDGRLAAIRGDDEDPFSRGHICPKGNAILDLEADPDRLRRPLLKRNGQFKEIGWDEAIAIAGERLAAIQAEHGSNAVGAYLGNPNVHHFGSIAYAPNLLRALRSRSVFSASSVDQWPHQVVNWAMFGHQFLLPVPDVDRTDWFLMIGANPVASNGSLFTAPGIAARLKALAARGRLVVVDPRRTETAEIASEHLFIRPGTDAFFLAALLRALRRLGSPRLAHYRGRVRGLETALAALEALEGIDLEERTGVSRVTVERLAAELWAAPKAVVYGRIGISTQPFGSLCQWLVQLINLYTGNLDREGGALFNEPILPITGPGTQAGHHGVWHSRVRGLPEFAGELPVSALTEEILTPGDGRIRGLITFAGNPVLSTPDGRQLERALGALDFMVSVDIYVNETTRHADLILPPASGLTQYHYDLIFNAFAVRRVARLNAPILAMSGDERADWQIINALGEAWSRSAGKPFRSLPPPRELIAAGLARGDGGLSLTDLEGAPHGLDLGPLRPSLLARIETESGCIECAPSILLADVDRLCSAPQAPSDTLLLIGRRHVRSNNSWMHNAPRLVKGRPRHHLLMHPDDLAARGIADGAQVRITSRVGSVETEVSASSTMMPGVVSLPHGFGHQRDAVRLDRARRVIGASYNDLSDPERIDAPSGNAALCGLPVVVEAAGSPAEPQRTARTSASQGS